MKLLPKTSCGYFPGSPKSCQVQKGQCGRYKASPLTPHGSVLFVVPRVCYERSSLSPTIQTFILSAIWHGVYPGYYLTFLTGVVMTLAARAVSIKNFISYFNGSLLELLRRWRKPLPRQALVSTPLWLEVRRVPGVFAQGGCGLHAWFIREDWTHGAATQCSLSLQNFLRGAGT